MSEKLNNESSYYPLYYVSPLLQKECDNHRLVMITGEVRLSLAREINAKLLMLEGQDRTKEITVVIMSPGGCVSAGLSIYDTMRMISCPITTVVVGYAYSMGAILTVAGDYRMMEPHAKFMIHQIIGQTRGSLSDVLLRVKELTWAQDKLFGILAERSGKTLEEIKELCDRDKYFSAEEALEHNFIDEIVSSRKLKKVMRVPVKATEIIEMENKEYDENKE